MAEKKQIKTSAKGTNRSRRTTSIKSRKVTRVKYQNRLLDYFRFSESYTSLVLGIVVVIVTTILIISTIKDKNTPNYPRKETSSISTSKDEEIVREQSKEEITYIVKEGDNLWSIAEKEYNNGYKWTLIAQTNKIQNPDVVEVGKKLVIPLENQSQDEQTNIDNNSVALSSQDQIESSKVQSEIKKYTVKRGDYLWAIAKKEYGNGYRWVDIARANNLANPDIIHSGNELIIPSP